MLFVFFFKQKTAYEMLISDWSSDVCSSDLEPNGNIGEARIERSDAVHRKLRLQGQICVARCKDIRRRGGDEAVRSEGCLKIGRVVAEDIVGPDLDERPNPREARGGFDPARTRGYGKVDPKKEEGAVTSQPRFDD